MFLSLKNPHLKEPTTMNIAVGLDGEGKHEYSWPLEQEFKSFYVKIYVGWSILDTSSGNIHCHLQHTAVHAATTILHIIQEKR